MSTYSLLKLVHVVAAIVAVGTNVTYFLWLARIRRHPRSEQAVVLNGLRGPAAHRVLAGALFGPALRRQVELVASDEEAPAAYAEVARRTTKFGLLTMLPIAAILYLMVIKPTP